LILSKSLTEAIHKGTIDRFVDRNVSFVDAIAQSALNADILKFGGTIFERAALVRAIAEFGGTCVTGAVVFVNVFEEAIGGRR
jgi:uncharacterized membrane protein